MPRAATLLVAWPTLPFQTPRRPPAFGPVVEGMDVVDRIDAAPIDGAAPVTRIGIVKVRIQ